MDDLRPVGYRHDKKRNDDGFTDPPVPSARNWSSELVLRNIRYRRRPGICVLIDVVEPNDSGVGAGVKRSGMTVDL